MSNPSMATVGTRPAAAYAGQDMSPLEPTNSFMNEHATGIEAGVPVARGATAIGSLGEPCKPWTLDADDFLGPSLRYPDTDAGTSGNVTYDQRKSVPVKASGRVAVIAGEAVRGGDEVLIITASGNDPTLCWGSSRGGVAGTGRVVATGWKWCGAGNIAAGTICEIEGRGAVRGRITT
jgi:hypothetical protein